MGNRFVASTLCLALIGLFAPSYTWKTSAQQTHLIFLPRITNEVSYESVIRTTPGLISYWRLDDRGGIAADSAGANNGMISGGVIQGIAGALRGDDTAMTFDGVSGFMSVPDAADLNLTGNLTLEAWVRLDRIDPQSQTILGKGTGDASRLRQYRIGLTTANGGSPHLRGTVYVGSSLYTAEGQMTPQTGTWYALALVRDGNTLTFYVNGVAEGTTHLPQGGANNVTSGPLTIARLALASDPQYFQGSIDEVAIYQVALTAAQIQAHYALATH